MRVRRRRVRIVAALAASILAVAVLGVGLRRLTTPSPLSPAGGPAAIFVGRVEVVAGDVRAVATRAVEVGEEVRAGSDWQTGDGARLVLRLGSGHSVRVDERSRLRVHGPGQLDLERGALYVDSGGPAAPAAVPVEIRTPGGIVRETGTQYEVRRDGGTVRVRVREGAVAVVQTAATHTVVAGQELSLQPSGDVTRADCAVYGPDWSWAERAAPVPDIEGRPLDEVLRWLARERGLRLVYSPGTPDAAGIRLAGSIRGMTLDEALVSVLATSGMRHSVEQDRLVLAPSE